MSTTRPAVDPSLTRALPIAVIGAGPIGLAAAAHLIERGERLLVFEVGDAPAATVRSWGHVRMFSPWRHLIDPVSQRLLERSGWSAPDPSAIPLGRELLDQYLEPLSQLSPVADSLRYGQKVTHLGRSESDKLKGARREHSPFEVVVQGKGGQERHLVKAVLDASGSFQTPSPLGANGLPADGESAALDHIVYGIPDPLFRDRKRYAGRRILVVGNGDSALHVLLALDALAREGTGTSVAWAVRGEPSPARLEDAPTGPLPERTNLRRRAQRLVDEGRVRLISHFSIRSLRTSGSGVHLGNGSREIGPFDEIVAATGSRPDLSINRELWLELDPRLECPIHLAPLIDPDLHSCETVPLHGYEELRQPEPGFHLLGMKSYGRAPGFLLTTGYAQVRSVTSALVGDLEGAQVHGKDGVTHGACSPSQSTAGSDRPSPATLAAPSMERCCG